MDSALKYEALDLGALTLKVSISGSVPLRQQSSKDYPLMMLFVMDVMAFTIKLCTYKHIDLELLDNKLILSLI